MSITTEDELKKLREAGRIVAGALAAMSAEVRPGITTAELDEIGGRYFAERGAQSSPQLVYGFPGKTCISVNDEVVHGIPRDRKLMAGDLVKLDVTAEKDGFHADAAVSVTVPPADEVSLRLIQCAKQAFRAGAAAARAGARTSEVGGAVETEVKRYGFHVIRDLGGHGIGRARADDRADYRGGDRRCEFEQRRLDDANGGWKPGGALRAHPGDHEGRADAVDGGVSEERSR
jgi:methionyl aminopeptidase